jgi:hypothetical protein
VKQRVGQIAVWFSGLKYIWSVGTGGEELYDVAADPGERTNLVSASPEVTRDLSARLDAWLAAHGVGSDGSGYREATSDVAPAVADQLRALGYVE